jgi:predicted membrane protein
MQRSRVKSSNALLSILRAVVVMIDQSRYAAATSAMARLLARRIDSVSLLCNLRGSS